VLRNEKSTGVIYDHIQRVFKDTPATSTYFAQSLAFGGKDENALPESVYDINPTSRVKSDIPRELQKWITK